MAKRKAPEKEENLERWLLTYSDMITLLMLFFIVMYAMSVVDQVKFEQLAASLNSAFEVPNGEQMMSIGVAGGDKARVETNAFPKQNNPTKYTFDNAYDIIKSALKDDKVKIRQEARGIIIQLGGDLFFKPASAEVNQESADVVYKISELLDRLLSNNDILVEGHTDTIALDSANSEYKDNWDLSYHRSYNVFNLLRAYLDEKRMQIVALGDSRPLTSNDTPESRAYERRVDIVILRSDTNPSPKPSTAVESGLTSPVQ